MPPLRVLAAVLALCTLLGPFPVLATPLVPTLSDRTVFAEALAESGPRNSTQSNGDGAVEFEPLDTSVTAVAPANAASGDAEASQTSSLADDRFDAAGEARAAAVLGGDEDLAFAAADSFFLIVFESDISAPFVLEGLLTGEGAGDVFARVELVEELGGQVIFSFEVGPGESLVLDEEGLLEAGTSYELLAVASVARDGVDAPPAEGRAAFDFAFRVVPEPGSAWLVALGLAALTRRGAR